MTGAVELDGHDLKDYNRNELRGAFGMVLQDTWLFKGGIYDYVVIEREYGSGGTAIGKLLSENTNIPCYGSEILERVSAKLQIPIADIQQYEESTTNSFLYSIYAFTKMNDGSESFLSKENHIFLDEQHLIREYALSSPAIFVGRCAASALEDKKVLRIYIHADPKIRKQRAEKEYGIPKICWTAPWQNSTRKERTIIWSTREKSGMTRVIMT